MTVSEWPQQLHPVSGPFSAARIDGAAEGMGAHGPATRAVAADGLVQPDLLTGMTLFLLARQPRSPAGDVEEQAPKKASPIDGGVWVREQFTMHRPLARSDPFTVRGSSTGRYVRKARRYGTTTSQSFDETGRLTVSNLTTGLLAYKVVDGLADEVEGLPLEETPAPEPDHAAAQANPHLDALRAATPGQRLGGDRLAVTLAMMTARDTASPDNPIHSDPEAAAAAGLDRPIAGGSHVLAFALEPILATFGPQSLFHGAFVDVRWKAPTHAEAEIVPKVVVSSVASDRVEFDIEVDLVAASTAMVASVLIPLPA